ncbi:hypothetical protein ACO0LD_12745 [Undibacterium sp. Ji83W]|uniref:hypothetical protein n=1 Tax=Undibacterium sp. Ji83W TaxID=3413043 RepID=UPI003BF3D1B6
MKGNHHYHPDDAWHIIRAIPYMRVANYPVRILKQMDAAGLAYRKFLSQYPTVRCEPLDFFYECKRGIMALDKQLLSDLLFTASWREANCGVWLALLAPKLEYKELLERMLPNQPHAESSLTLALAAIDGHVLPEREKEFAYLSNVRSMLDEIPDFSVPLRTALTSEQMPWYELERTAICETLKKDGLQGAQVLMRKGLFGYYRKDYRTWLRDGAAPYIADTHGNIKAKFKTRWKFW